jgi:hypothetical protein
MSIFFFRQSNCKHLFPILQFRYSTSDHISFTNKGSIENFDNPDIDYLPTTFSQSRSFKNSLHSVQQLLAIVTYPS